MSKHFSLRVATKEDASFIYQVTEKTMRGYAEATWGQWLADQARLTIQAEAQSGLTQIIQFEEHEIGVLRRIHEAEHDQLEQLYILPEWQGKGIARAIVQSAQAESRVRAVPLRLRVLRVNPARLFYERLGFTVTSETTERFYMESIGL